MIEGGGPGRVRPRGRSGPLDVQVANGVVDVAVADEAEAVAVAKQYLAYFAGPVEGVDGAAPGGAARRRAARTGARPTTSAAAIGGLADDGSVLELRAGLRRSAWSRRSPGSRAARSASWPTTRRTSPAPSTPTAPTRPPGSCSCATPTTSRCCSSATRRGSWSGPTPRRRGRCATPRRLFVTGANLIGAVRHDRPAQGLRPRRPGHGGRAASRRRCSASPGPPASSAAWASRARCASASARSWRRSTTRTSARQAFQQMVDRAYEHGKALNAASHFEIDDVIDPADSRRWITHAAPPGHRRRRGASAAPASTPGDRSSGRTPTSGMTTRPARALAGALEPFVGQVYFSPECHQAYEALGFAASPGATGNRRGPARRRRLLHQPGVVDGPGAGRGRGRRLRRVRPRPPSASASPMGWSLTDAAHHPAPPASTAPPPSSPGSWARRPTASTGSPSCSPGPATGSTRRPAAVRRHVLGDAARRPARRRLGARRPAAGVPRRLPHGGLDERPATARPRSRWSPRCGGPPLKSYSRSRGWSAEALDAAIERLRQLGDLDGDGLTAAGRTRRDAVEAATDVPCRRSSTTSAATSTSCRRRGAGARRRRRRWVPELPPARGLSAPARCQALRVRDRPRAPWGRGGSRCPPCASPPPARRARARRGERRSARAGPR